MKYLRVKMLDTEHLQIMAQADMAPTMEDLLALAIMVLVLSQAAMMDMDMAMVLIWDLMTMAMVVDRHIRTLAPTTLHRTLLQAFHLVPIQGLHMVVAQTLPLLMRAQDFSGHLTRRVYMRAQDCHLTIHLLELEPMQVGQAPQVSTNHPADTTILRHCVRPLLPRDRQRLSLSRDCRLKRHWRPSIWHLARTHAIRICRYKTSSLSYESW